MSNINLPALIEEISHEISRDEKGWYFTQAAAARISGIDRKTISEGLTQPFPNLGLRVTGSKMLKAFAAQGISPAGLEQFQGQWRTGRITDVMVRASVR